MRYLMTAAFLPLLVLPVAAEDVETVALAPDDPIAVEPAEPAEPGLTSPSGPRHRWVVAKKQDTATLAEASRREEIKRLYPDAVYHGPK